MRETLVLVPGLNCTAELFTPQLEALRTHVDVKFAEHRLDEDMKRIAQRLLADAPERFALVGLSMGGYVALEVMRQAPKRVTRLALMDTAARADGDEAKERRRGLVELAQTGRFEDVHALLWEKLVSPAHRADWNIESTVKRMMSDTGPDAFVRQQRAIMSRADSRALLPDIEIPTLVLVGEEDAITPVEVAREMAEAIEWASLTIVPGSGHLSTLEQPDRVSAALLAWLAVERS